MTMKPYGIRRRDFGCRPGHDKFPRDTYGNRRSKKARSLRNKILHRHARAVLNCRFHRLLDEARS